MLESTTDSVPASERPGYFGKLPCRADFLSSGLPPAFTGFWHRWLQDAVTIGRDLLGEEWLDIYLTGPLWRFVVWPGLCGEQAWAGVLIPSTDRVQRCFPFTVAAPVGAGCCSVDLLGASTRWFASVEATLFGFVEDDFDPAELEARVEALGPLTVAGRRLERRRRPVVDVGCLDPLENGYVELARSMVCEPHGPYSLWLTRGSDEMAEVLAVCRGFPPPHCFASMLDEGWTDPRRESEGVVVIRGRHPRA